MNEAWPATNTGDGCGSRPPAEPHAGCGELTCPVCRSTGLPGPVSAALPPCECSVAPHAPARLPGAGPSGVPVAHKSIRCGPENPHPPRRTWPVATFDSSFFPTADGTFSAPFPESWPGLSQEGPASRPPTSPQDALDPARQGMAGQHPAGQPTADTKGGSQGADGATAGSCAANLYSEYQDPGGAIVLVGDSLLSFADAFALDAAVLLFMGANQIPNGTLSVVSPDGRLVHVRGYTNRVAYTNALEEPFIAGPNSRFRVASVSKTLTAIATVQLEQAGILPDGLQTKVGAYVDLKVVPPIRTTSDPPYVVSYTPAARVDEIRVIHLLTHTGGWFEGSPQQDTSSASGGVYVQNTCPAVLWADQATIANTMASASGPFPTAQYAEITTAFGSTLPVTFNQILRWANTLPLSKPPGERYHYSNYGYWLLGRFIEGVTCRSYSSFVRDELLLPLGMFDTVMGETPRAARALREVPYFAELWPWQSGSTSLSAVQSSPYEAGPVDYEPYAAFDIKNYDAHGGWLSSGYDLALLLAEVFNDRTGLLSVASRILLLYPWVCRDYAGRTAGLGFEHSGSSIRKGGQFTGSIARIENRAGNSAGACSFAYAFNRNWSGLPSVPENETNMLTTIQNQLDQVTDWGGADDLFAP